MFTYTDLGNLGGPEARAYGLNDARQVVGWSNVSDTIDCLTEGRPCRHAFLWEDGVMTNLGFLDGDEESVARAINDAGLIVGTSERDVIAGSGTFHGVTWQGGSITALPDLGQGQSFVHDVNEAGQITGWTQDPSVNRDRAVRWDAGAIVNIGDTEPHSYNRGTGLNDGGVVVGMAWNLFEPNDAILFDGAMWFTIGGSGQFQNAEARDVNNTGTAVGLMAFPSGNWHATMWSGGPGVDLGTLPGMDLSELNDVNDAGHAVGLAYSDTLNSRAIYWDGDQLHDLNELVGSTFTGVLIEATEINEAGDIVGTALVDGAFHAFLLTVGGATCEGDVDGNGIVDFTDLLEVLATWGPCAGCPADIDGDDVVGFGDLLLLLSKWGPCAG
jgi:probable HAF family extracellular repeat protein